MNILIVEDEARIARRIERMTRDILGNRLQSLTHRSTLDKAMQFIENNDLDIVLLDLNLHGDSGFGLLTTVLSASFHTIIVSAHKEQAIKAFEYGVLDFVPKPFNRERLEEAFNRAAFKEKATLSTTKFLAVNKRHKIELISIDNVRYIKGAGVYAELMLNDGTKALHSKSLDKLEQLLSPGFYRIHKSYLVKMTEISKIIVASGSKYIAELKNKESLPIGRTKYKGLKEQWV